jgi:hypothetical protein
MKFLVNVLGQFLYQFTQPTSTISFGDGRVRNGAPRGSNYELYLPSSLRQAWKCALRNVRLQQAYDGYISKELSWRRAR